MKRLNCLYFTIFFLACQHYLLEGTVIRQESDTSVKDYTSGYSYDEAWPLFVTPLEKIFIPDKDIHLPANLRTVFVRAYPDEMIAVTGRDGTVIIPHEKTNFLTQVREKVSGEDIEDPELKRPGVLTAQISRRAFHPNFHESRAVSEDFASSFDYYLVIKIEASPDALTAVASEIDKFEDQLKGSNTCVLIALEQPVAPAEFVAYIDKLPSETAIMSPVYGIALINTLFTEREQDQSMLLLKQSGKLLSTASSIEGLHDLLSKTKQSY